MIGWFRGRLGGKPKVWKYVGHSDVGMVDTHRMTNKKTNFVVKILYYMTDDGDRKVEMQTTNEGAAKWINDYSNRWQDALVWTKGGSFPEHFNAENDVLGDMLSRLIDQKITGEK